MSGVDVVDTGRSKRFCPYCHRLQFWSPSEQAFCHDHNLNLHCDEERLALWDMSESLRATRKAEGEQ